MIGTDNVTNEGYVDIHSHILHAVDDGAANLAEARKMLELAYSEGIRIICTTPHFHPGSHEGQRMLIEERLTELRRLAADCVPGLEIVPGNELHYGESAVAALNSGACRCLGSGRYVLVEFHPGREYTHLREGLNRLITSGYIPILAHVERYTCLKKQTSRVSELIQMGAYIQVNAKSVLSRQTSRWVKGLLQDELVHFIATDSHNARDRAPQLKACGAYIAKKYGEYARLLLRENPLRAIRGEYI